MRAFALVFLVGCNHATVAPDIDGSSPPPAIDGAVDAPTPGVARLVAPLSTSTVTQRAPTLRWAGLDATTAAPTVDLCLDRACAYPFAIGVTMAADHASAKVAADLPPGWVFWRVHAGAATTPTWQFWVPRLSASTPVDVATGSMFDVNGDGYADVLVPGANAASLLLGQAGGGFAQTIELVSPDTTACNCFGGAVQNIGDVNGDGFADFYVSSPGHLYLGGADAGGDTWNGATATRRIDGWTPSTVVGLGDVNGDGYADFLLPTQTPILVVLGSPTPSPTGVAVTPTSSDLAAQTIFPYGYGAAGDVNGDGYADFVLSSIAHASDAPPEVGFARLYLGGPAPSGDRWNVDGAPDRVDIISPDANQPYGSLFGSSAMGIGDVDGDGYSDFAIGAEYGQTPTIGYPGLVHVFLGSPTGPAATANLDIAGPVQMAELGESIAPVGDVDGDGYADFLVGEADNQSVQQIGGARLYLGGATPSLATWNGDAPAKRVDVVSPDGSYGYFGRAVTGIGDTDGDGYADFAVHAKGTAMHFYRGEATFTDADYNGTAPPRRTDLP